MNDEESIDQFIGQQASMVTHNRRLMAQMDDRMRCGFDASLQGADHVVIRSRVTQVMLVLGAGAASGRGEPLFGPASFARCLEFVNVIMVTRMAESDDPDQVAHQEGSAT